MKKLLIYTIPVILFLGCNQGQTGQSEGQTDNEVFIWNFKTPQKLEYSFSQGINGFASNELDRREIVLSSQGTLYVDIDENQKAQVGITDLNASENDDEYGRSNWQNLGPIPDVPASTLAANGEITDDQADKLLYLLFLLPPSDLTPGQSAVMKRKIPVNNMAVNEIVKGEMALKGKNVEITFMGYKKVMGRKCAILETNINLFDMKAARRSIRGNIKFTITGTGEYYFDTEKQVFVGADIEFLVDFVLKSKGMLGKSVGRSNNVVKYRLKEPQQ